ncbi:MAG: type II toxin-antitoxin system VapC family toxin [Synechococcus sp.]
MTKYLLDTNVVLRLCNAADRKYKLATQAVATLLIQSDECYLTAQVLMELWVVATRPASSNGLGWTAQQTHDVIAKLLDRFPTAEETPKIFPTWLDLVTETQVIGKRAHDVHLVATMFACGIDRLLTFNPSDFNGIPGITVVEPRTIVDSDKTSTKID